MRLGGKPGKLVGERIELRRHVRENYPLYGEWYGDREIWHLTSWRSKPMSPSETERFFEDREMSRTDSSFAIHAKGRKGPIGVISLINISGSNGSADLSVIVGPRRERRQGYGTEAITEMLRYGFTELGLNRIGLSVFEFNTDAIAAYQKLGFRYEGRLRQAIRRDGAFHDAILMSMLRREWRDYRERT